MSDDNDSLALWRQYLNFIETRDRARGERRAVEKSEGRNE